MAQHGFQYVTWCFDGDDIIFTVREQSGDVDYSQGEYFHNCYTITFYRLSDYRSLLKYDSINSDVVNDTDSMEDSSSDTADAKKGCQNVIDGSSFVSVAIIYGTVTLVLKKKRKI